MPRRNTERSTSIEAKFSKIAWEVLSSVYGFSLSEQSRSNLIELDKILEENAAVLYFNHVSFADVPILVALVLANIRNAKKRLGPIGIKHTDFKRKPISALLMKLLKPLGVKAVPIVQKNDLHNYSPEEAEGLLAILKEETVRLLSSTNSIYGIFPEGTRNKKGGLRKANRGIGHLAKYNLNNLFYVPISLVYGKHSDKPELVVGEPMKTSQILPEGITLPIDDKDRAQFIADAHMRRLAKQMPKDLRGHYED